MVEKTNKGRGLSNSFMNDLKEGLLSPFLTLVREDATLCLQIREKYINIYYRGGNLIKISTKNPDKHVYLSYFNPKYAKYMDKELQNSIEKLSPDFESEHDVKRWIDIIPLLKHTMDIWFSYHPKSEKEFQQVVLRENNGETIGASTDYFIIDIEYDNREDARFDMIAIRWDSEGSIRKLQKGHRPILTFMEMKFGDGALSGKAGMLEHIERFKDFANPQNIENIKREMLNVFQQQRDLELIPALKKNRNSVKGFADNVDYLFILANHDPASRTLNDILKKVSKIYSDNKDLGFNLKFCVSNVMGYGIYKENVYSLYDFMNRFNRQILCE